MTVNSELYREVLDNLYEGIYLVNHERKIVFWNSAAEKVTGYLHPDVIGKQCGDSFFRHTNHKGTCLCKHNCPMEKAFKDLRAREIDVYSHHQDGSRILTRVQFSPVKDPAGHTIMAVKFNPAAALSTSSTSRFYDEHLKKEPQNEKLPMVEDRLAIAQRLEKSLDELRRYGWSFGMLFLSVDNFDTILAQYGYPYWYRIVRGVAETIANNLRTSDTIGRWSDNEFVVLVLNIGSVELKTLAERLRIMVAQLQLTFYKEKLSFTISLGASTAVSEDTVPDITDRCESLLRRSLSAGGNVVSL